MILLDRLRLTINSSFTTHILGLPGLGGDSISKISRC